jgi:lipoprotein-releasing system permease protein
MFFLAWRHLTSKVKQTLLTLLGITLGTAAYVTISGMMMGFQVFILEQLVNNDAHIRISAREDFITKELVEKSLFSQMAHVFWLSPPGGLRESAKVETPHIWFERLKKDSHVTAFSPQLVAQALIRKGGASLTGRIIGSEPAKQILVTNIQNYMIEGRFLDLATAGNKIVVGEGILSLLGARVGDTITLATAKGEPVPFRIIGAFRLGIKTLDESTLFAHLTDVQTVNKTPSQISDIALRIDDVTRARETAETWSAFSHDKIQSWDQINEGTLSVFKTQDIIRNAMTISILIVAGFGIYNILTMAVNQKRREIAILRSMGYEPQDIINLFLIQGLLLGTVGSTAGVGLGYIFCRLMEQIPVSNQRILGSGKMLVSFDPMIYTKAFVLGFCAAIVASLLPARAAGKLEPIEIIRSEAS